MAERPKRRPARSVAQTQLKQLEARLARLEDQLKTLHTEASGSVGAARAKVFWTENHEPADPTTMSPLP